MRSPLQQRKKSFPKLNGRGLVLSLLWTLVIAAVCSTLLLRGEAGFPDSPSLAVTDRYGELLRVYLNNREQWCLPLERSEPIPEKLTRAVSLYEDKNFFYHPGVDPPAVLRALYFNIRAGNSCGLGPNGTDPGGIERTLPACP